MATNSNSSALDALESLMTVVRTLRQQCPWDSAQTYESLRPNTIEEAMELADALMAGDPEAIKKELGDVLMHVLLYACIAEEKGQFDFTDVCNAVREKLVFRHPHIYAGAPSAAEGGETWEEIKLREKGGNKTVLGGVPRSLPSLIKAERIQEKAASVGFDWECKEDVWAKVREETGEVERELVDGHEADREKEFGDLLFSVVNAARLYGVRPDNALERTNRKFTARFNHIEAAASSQGRRINELTLAEMDALWDEAKRLRLGEEDDR